MRDRRDPEEISQDLFAAETRGGQLRSKREDSHRERYPHGAEFAGTGRPLSGSGKPQVTDARVMEAARAGLDGRFARFFSWLGNHFFGVTLVLTGAFLFWALR